jgi:hypothetical protein
MTPHPNEKAFRTDPRVSQPNEKAFLADPLGSEPNEKAFLADPWGRNRTKNRSWVSFVAAYMNCKHEQRR